MSDEIAGHYNKDKEALLKALDQTIGLMEESLVARYGKDLAHTLQGEVLDEFERLIPEIPYIQGMRARPLNTFLLTTAQELATYKAMAKHGKPPEEAWELCHEALRLKLAQIPKWKRWLWKVLMFSFPVKKVMEIRARQKQRARFGNFEIEYLIGDGNGFSFGVNYLQCGNLDFVKKHGGEAFAPYICMSDIALSDAIGWGLIRTQTLADGCSQCDFRFTEGGATKISSRSPEVQETIERIRKKESEQNTCGIETHNPSTQLRESQ